MNADTLNILEQIMPLAGWTLYDFGGHTTIMPVPKHEESGVYLTRKLFGLVSADYKRFTFIETNSHGEDFKSLIPRIDAAISDSRPNLKDALNNIHTA